MDYGFMVERVVSMQTTHYQFLTGIEPLSVCVRKGVWLLKVGFPPLSKGVKICLTT